MSSYLAPTKEFKAYRTRPYRYLLILCPFAAEWKLCVLHLVSHTGCSVIVLLV